MTSRGGRVAGWIACLALTGLAVAGFVYLGTLQKKAPPAPELESGIPAITRNDYVEPEIQRRIEDGPELEIPAIGVATSVVELGKNPDGTLETPTNFDQAGWWAGGPSPGRRGPAVVTGHVDRVDQGPAVFYKLFELERGDVVLYTNKRGREVQFRVQGSEQYSKDAFPTQRVYGRTKGAELRLVTCIGTFDPTAGSYRDNLVVYARRV